MTMAHFICVELLKSPVAKFLEGILKIMEESLASFPPYSQIPVLWEMPVVVQLVLFNPYPIIKIIGLDSIEPNKLLLTDEGAEDTI